MVNSYIGRLIVNSAIEYTIVFLVFLSFSVPVYCEESNDSQICVDKDLQSLSKDAAVVVVSHLGKALQLLQAGGPPVDISASERSAWTLENQLEKQISPSVNYTKEQYLSDYRQSFLEQWSNYLRNNVAKDSSGVYHIGSGCAFGTCCFQNQGTTRGYYDAQSLAGKLVFQVYRETHDPAGVIGQSNKGKKPSPNREAAIFIVEHFIVKKKPTGTVTLHFRAAKSSKPARVEEDNGGVETGIAPN